MGWSWWRCRRSPSFPASKSQLPHPGKGANSGNSPAPASSINLYRHLQIPQDCRSQSHLAARGHSHMLPAMQAENAIPEKAWTRSQLWEPEAGVAACAHGSLSLLGGPRKPALPHFGQAALHGTASRITTRIPGITPPSQGLFPKPGGCFSIRNCSPMTSSRDSPRRGGPGKPPQVWQWECGKAASPSF